MIKIAGKYTQFYWNLDLKHNDCAITEQSLTIKKRKLEKIISLPVC